MSGIIGDDNESDVIVGEVKSSVRLSLIAPCKYLQDVHERTSALCSMS